MNSPNELRLDLSGNEDVAAALESYYVGDDYCITICGKVTSKDDQTFVGSIDEIEHDQAEDGEEASEVNSDAPVIAMMVARKKSGKSGPVKVQVEKDDAEETDTET